MKARDRGKDDTLALPVEVVYPVRGLLKTSDRHIETRKLNEIAELLRLPQGLSEDEKNSRIIRAVDLYESLAPSDGLEGMLSVQMVGTHSAALECLRMAAVPGQTFEARDMNLRHAGRLMALYLRQVAALDKYRGRGQQKVTVEHVHVAAGGQAIVGNVDARRGAAAQAPSPEPQAVEKAVESPLEPMPPAEPAKAARHADLPAGRPQPGKSAAGKPAPGRPEQA